MKSPLGWGRATPWRVFVDTEEDRATGVARPQRKIMT